MIKLTLDAIGKFYKYDKYISLTRMFRSTDNWFVRYLSVYCADRIK